MAQAGTEVLVSATSTLLAETVAARLLQTIEQAQQGGGRARLALTAGGIMEQVWAELARIVGSAQAIDWSRVDVYWGDERFVPTGSADRNDTPADQLLFDHPPFDQAHRHPMPASDGPWGTDLDAAAAGYANALAEAATVDDTGDVPNFEVALLGVGPDGHCCSLFPDHPSASDDSASVIAVRDSPKPPPLRISLSFAGLNSAKQVWAVVSGSAKADAVAKALSGDYDRAQIPSGSAHGRERTIWFLDRDAAAGLHA